MLSPRDHCHAGVDITRTPTSLNSMKKVFLLLCWNTREQVLSPISNEGRTGTTLLSLTSSLRQVAHGPRTKLSSLLEIELLRKFAKLKLLVCCYVVLGMFVCFF